MARNAHDFFFDAGMSDRAEYYYGIDEGPKYVDSVKLEKIYSLLKKEKTKTAADGFVKAVAGLTFVAEDMSACTFVNTVYNLESIGWQYDPDVLPKEGAKHQESEHPTGMMIGLIMAMKNDTQKPDPEVQRRKRHEVVASFLLNHIDEVSDEGQKQRIQKMRHSSCDW